VSRRRSVVALYELDEHASGALRMEESNEVTARSAARLLVDETEAFGAQPGEIRSQIVAAIGDVVETGAATGQKASHGGIGGEGLEELH